MDATQSSGSNYSFLAPTTDQTAAQKPTASKPTTQKKTQSTAPSPAFALNNLFTGFQQPQPQTQEATTSAKGTPSAHSKPHYARGSAKNILTPLQKKQLELQKQLEAENEYVEGETSEDDESSDSLSTDKGKAVRKESKKEQQKIERLTDKVTENVLQILVDNSIATSGSSTPLQLAPQTEKSGMVAAALKNEVEAKAAALKKEAKAETEPSTLWHNSSIWAGRIAILTAGTALAYQSYLFYQFLNESPELNDKPIAYKHAKAIVAKEFMNLATGVLTYTGAGAVAGAGLGILYTSADRTCRSVYAFFSKNNG